MVPPRLGFSTASAVAERLRQQVKLLPKDAFGKNGAAGSAVTMPSIDKLFDKAEKLLKKQRYDSALEVFAEIHQYDPEDESVLLNLGDISLKVNRTADALRYWAF